MKKTLKYTLFAAAVICLLYFLPLAGILFIFCGIYDVSRNTDLDFSVVKQYFLGNGALTCLASPVNVFLDILSLPFINRGVYQLNDLPPAYRLEITELLDSVNRANLVEKLESRLGDASRAMFFFKWYGKNVKNSLDISTFDKDYRYIKTIGVSVFKKRECTSRHFGPFRAMFRVLYCLNEVTDENVYIKVGKTENRWKDEKLFIFDDTLLHQSFNDSDNPRYCLFVDIVRPNFLNFFFNLAIRMIRFSFKGINGIFYKKWKLINN